MGLNINKEAYKRLIQEDLDFLNKHIPDGSIELDHIKLILCKSIDWYYPDKMTKCCQIQHISCDKPLSPPTADLIGKIADEAYEIK